MKYEYFDPTTKQRVTLPKSSFFKKRTCEHEMVPLIRDVKGRVLHNTQGDTIQYVCRKCGELGKIEFWEFDGWGYRKDN